MRATKTMHVEASPEQVMSFLLDSTAIPRGMTMEVVRESPDVVGNTYAWTFRVLGIPGKGVTVYTEYIPAEHLVVRDFGTLEGTVTYAIEPEDGGSKLTLQRDTHLAVPLVGRFLGPVLEKVWEKNVAWAKREMEKRAKAEKTTA